MLLVDVGGLVPGHLFVCLTQEEFDALSSVCCHWSRVAPNQNMATAQQRGWATEVATARGRKIVIHNCLTKADLRSLFISHMGFQFAQATLIQNRMIVLYWILRW